MRQESGGDIGGGSGERDARALVEAVLGELGPEAVLLAFDETADGRGCRLAVQQGGDLGKSLVVPRAWIDAAVRDPGVAQSLRRLLRTELLAMRARAVTAEPRRTMASVERPPVCSRCARPIPPDAPGTAQAGELELG
jgi:hypothetical protein